MLVHEQLGKASSDPARDPEPATSACPYLGNRPGMSQSIRPGFEKLKANGPQVILRIDFSQTGLITIKEAHDIEARLNEVEKLLKTIINMPWKYSRSEVVLTFFERSPLDQVLKNDNVHKIQPSFQSPVKISEIMRSNGFCLANTETIVIDHSIPNGKEKHLDVDSAEHLFESVSDFTSELEDSDDPTAYVTNLTYYHLVPFETDILD
ncbi:PX domain-containing protein 1 [Aix galericulata]|nr:PX domain-containing protein 1 [Aix galericulata]